MTLLSLVLATHASHAGEPMVALRFGWKPGLSCDVQTRTTGPAGTRVVNGAVAVESAPDGVRLVAGGDSALDPAVVIGGDGHLRRLEADEGKTALNRLSLAWERAFGMWSGLTVPESVSGSAVQYGPSAVYPAGASTDWFYRFHIADRADCDGVRGGPMCVTLAYDADAFGSGVKQVLDRGLAAELGGGDPTWQSPKITLRGQLKVEESTLIPLSRTEEHTIKVAAVSPFGATEAVTRVVRTEETWSCDYAPAVAAAGDTGLPR